MDDQQWLQYQEQRRQSAALEELTRLGNYNATFNRQPRGVPTHEYNELVLKFNRSLEQIEELNDEIEQLKAELDLIKNPPAPPEPILDDVDDIEDMIYRSQQLFSRTVTKHA